MSFATSPLPIYLCEIARSNLTVALVPLLPLAHSAMPDCPDTPDAIYLERAFAEIGSAKPTFTRSITTRVLKVLISGFS